MTHVLIETCCLDLDINTFSHQFYVSLPCPFATLSNTSGHGVVVVADGWLTFVGGLRL